MVEEVETVFGQKHISNPKSVAQRNRNIVLAELAFDITPSGAVDERAGPPKRLLHGGAKPSRRASQFYACLGRQYLYNRPVGDGYQRIGRETREEGSGLDHLSELLK